MDYLFWKLLVTNNLLKIKRLKHTQDSDFKGFLDKDLQRCNAVQRKTQTVDRKILKDSGALTLCESTLILIQDKLFIPLLTFSFK